MKERAIAVRYAPILYFDELEPFYPEFAGFTILKESTPSPSSKRHIDFDAKRVGFVVEYAMYWDFDIQHLYELEHVWVYVGHDGEVVDCEASFHGTYFKGLLENRTNLEGTRVRLYAQPGKHAFMPDPDFFQIIPSLYTSTMEKAGNGGLLIMDMFKDELAITPELNEKVIRYLQGFAFLPSMTFKAYTWEEKQVVSWAELRQTIPIRIRDWLSRIDQEVADA